MDKAVGEFWRTLVVVHKVGGHVLYVSLPAANNLGVIPVLRSEVPEDVLAFLIAGEGERVHAHVNLGAVSVSDVRFHSWE